MTRGAPIIVRSVAAARVRAGRQDSVGGVDDGLATDRLSSGTIRRIDHWR